MDVASLTASQRRRFKRVAKLAAPAPGEPEDVQAEEAEAEAPTA
jgi:hypothetical protein